MYGEKKRKWGTHGGGDSGYDGGSGGKRKMSSSNVRNVCFFKLKIKFTKYFFLILKMGVKMFQR